MYVTYDLIGHLFGIDISNVCRNIKNIEPAIKACLPTPQKIHKKAKINNPLDLARAFPDLMTITDVAKQRVQRPENQKVQKQCYSDKRPNTIKTQITSNLDGLIIYRPKHVVVSVHDFTMYNVRNPKLPDDIICLYDLRYQGIQKIFPEQAYCPSKSPAAASLPHLTACSTRPYYLFGYA